MSVLLAVLVGALVGAAALGVWLRLIHRRRFERHCDDALRICGADRHPAGTRPGQPPPLRSIR